MEKLRRRLTSISTKQRFSEVLALVLIVGLMGLLVYLLIPTHTAAPKVAPVTVRSNSSVALQQHATTPAYQAPVANNKESQARDITNNSTPNTAVPEQMPVSNNVSHASTGNSAVRTPQIAKGVHGAQASISFGCAAVTKPVGSTLSKVGNALHLTSLVTSLVSDTSSCQS